MMNLQLSLTLRTIKIVPATGIPDGWMGFDIGPDSIKIFNDALDTTKTVIWNGPMGVFEFCQVCCWNRGCPCFSPDNLINHASIVMNFYYQCKGRNKWNCDFKNSALITMTDPRALASLFLEISIGP